MDLIGLDVGYDVKLALFEETGDPSDRPRDSLADKVRRAELGRKTGRGWYAYDEAGRKRPLSPEAP